MQHSGPSGQGPQRLLGPEAVAKALDEALVELDQVEPVVGSHGLDDPPGD
jgi:hypothetical protein